ncbi:Zinc transporter ZIP8 [Toxocara canis]|uniref:Zinc transporter ZIP8 n=2 Tax=Toxocara canis TaxID=6265 RepID=A0A0B2VTD5_TOXCA|nr:Zinc transporter ZIP8 [Toxocara canis]
MDDRDESMIKTNVLSAHIDCMFGNWSPVNNLYQRTTRSRHPLVDSIASFASLNCIRMISRAQLTMVSITSRSFTEVISEFRPTNGFDFCTKYLNNSLDINSVVIGEPPPAWQVWGIGLTMVTIISLSAACGIILLPFLSPKFYDRTLTYFVALGVGTLSGSAIFNLLPEAFDLLIFVPNYLAKAWTVLGGIYLFYLVDKLLAIVCTIKERTSVKPDMALSEKTNGNAFGSSPANTDTQPETLSPRRGSLESKKTHIASVAWLVVFGDALHNFIDGLSIGAAFNESLLAGISISVAVLCEELPHELGDCAILINSGMSLKQALIYNLASASTCFAGFVIGVIVGEINRNFGQFIFALAGGMFLYISLAGMLAEINKKAEEEMKRNLRAGVNMMLLQTAGLATGLIIMYLFAEYGSMISF